ncbi:A-kinase anchor protein 14 isoform X3 [Lethenteron reissneri]|uniref:A-kinase anchor protein 14 isoform X3 n=1 Tax=Lethenteron reissneri TaxID=7753 RepID=UPI002AB6B60C|nr:A-kinase anchor protein 14 isoform X3 [Lethenteron reissneri]
MSPRFLLIIRPCQLSKRRDERAMDATEGDVGVEREEERGEGIVERLSGGGQRVEEEKVVEVVEEEVVKVVEEVVVGERVEGREEVTKEERVDRESDKAEEAVKEIREGVKETGEGVKDEQDEGVNEAEEGVKEAEEAVKETGEAVKETEEGVKETGEAVKETREAVKETREGVKETGEAVKDEQEEAVKETREGMKETGEGVKEAVKEAREGVKETEEAVKEAVTDEQEEGLVCGVVAASISRAARTVTTETRLQRSHAADIAWVSCAQFTAEVGRGQIEEFLTTWRRSPLWLHCTEFVGEERCAWGRRCRYRVTWSLPTAHAPIPSASAQTHFTLLVASGRPPDSPVEVSFTFEGSGLVHRPGISVFRERWLSDILESKRLLLETRCLTATPPTTTIAATTTTTAATITAAAATTAATIHC